MTPKMLIKERCTSIEAYGCCPHKYNEVKFDENDIKTFIAVEIGKIVHTGHQYPETAHILADILFNEVLPAIEWKKDNIAKEQLHNIIEESRKRIAEFKDYSKEFEVQQTMLISGMLVTGSYDCHMIDKDWTHRLRDYKTAWWKWYYDSRTEKFQVQLYAYIIMKQFNLEKIKVTYQVYVKWKGNTKVSVERITKMFYMWKAWLLNTAEYIDEIAKRVEKLVDNFRMSKESGFFQPQDHNMKWDPTTACRYCNLRNKEEAAKIWQECCPLKLDRSSIEEVGGGELFG